MFLELLRAAKPSQLVLFGTLVTLAGEGVLVVRLDAIAPLVEQRAVDPELLSGLCVDDGGLGHHPDRLALEFVRVRFAFRHGLTPLRGSHVRQPSGSAPGRPLIGVDLLEDQLVVDQVDQDGVAGAELPAE